jgi:hypothetical protein
LVKKRGPKPKTNPVVSLPVPSIPKAVDSELPRKRGPKPKRKVQDTKSPDSESSDVTRPKKKFGKKKEECKKTEEDVVVKDSVDTTTSAHTKPTESAAPVTTNPQLFSVSVTRTSIDELPLPQLSPQVPSSLDERRISLPGPPPVIVPPANLPAPEPAPKEAAPVPAAVQLPAPDEEPIASCSRVLMDNTPPYTPERMPPPQPEPSAATPQASPHREDVQSTESEKEANMEVEKLMDTREPGGESPNACDTSTISNGSGGSSGNAPGSESDEMGPSNKRKIEEEEEEVPDKQPPKRRRRGAHKRVTAPEKPVKRTLRAAGWSTSILI